MKRRDLLGVAGATIALGARNAPAREQGIAIPQSILLRATRIIE